MKAPTSTRNRHSTLRQAIHALAESFSNAGGIYSFIWLICFIAILMMMDQPLSLPMIFVAGFLAIPTIYLIGLPIGILMVLLDGMLDIVESVHQGIRFARELEQDRERHRRRLP